MLKRFCLFYVFLLGLVACGDSAPLAKSQASGTSIVGGTEARPETPGASSVVMIYGESPENPAFICTGTFISEQWILTAGHCAPKSAMHLSLVFGLKPFETDPVSLTLVRTLRFDETESTSENRNDLALIQFSGGLPAGATIATLPEFSQKDPGVMWAMGYGRQDGVERLDAADLVGTGQLRTVEITSYDFKSDLKQFRVDQTSGRGVCFGDSGGPALIKNNQGQVQIVGVASAVMSAPGVDENAVGFDQCGQRSLYMNVGTYLSWIQSHLEEDMSKN